MDKLSKQDKDMNVPEFLLSHDDLLLIIKGLDLYGYSMIMSENLSQVMAVKRLVQKMLPYMPKPELNS